MSKKSNILIVNWGTATAEYPLRQAVELNRDNLFLAVTPKIPRSIKKLFKPKNLIYANPYDCQRLIEDVVDFMQKEKIIFDTVTTFFEMNVYQAAVLADYLGCKRYLPPSIALKTSVNKYLMRLTLQREDILQPKFMLFDKDQLKDAYNFYQKIEKPAVIKPVHSGHSYGARFIRKNLSFSSFSHIFEEATGDLCRSYDEWMDYENPTINRYYLIEEYIDGQMISCDGVVRERGRVEFIGTTEFRLTEPPLLQQIGHVVPIASLNREQIEQCKSYTTKIVSALRLRYCGFHCELKYAGGQPYLMEISGRLPGGGLLPSYQATSENNIFDLFFSIFEDRHRKKIIKNSDRFQSEAVITRYSLKRTGKVVNVFIPSIGESKNGKTTIKTVKKGEIYSNTADEMGIGIFTLRMQSKTMSSLELKEKSEELAAKIRVDIDDRPLTRLKIALREKRSFIKSFMRR